MKPELSDLIRAMARRDWGSADRLLEELGESGWHGGPQVIGAAFAIAVNRRFTRNSDIREIAGFVSETRGQFRGADALSALEMEGLIRGALGEAELVRDLDRERAFQVQMVVLGKLLQDLDMSESQLEAFIKEVETTAARFM